MKVLILDDDADLAASLADALRFEGHNVVLAATLSEARAAIEGLTDLDVAVLDVNIEAENSISLVRDLKQTMPALRVVSMTGGGRVRADLGMPLATAHGADAALLKPFTIDEFLNAIAPS
ncbi:MAG: response regulator [Pseudomonadota bacterium]